MISIAIIEDIKNIRETLKEFLGTQEEILVESASGSVEEFLKALSEESLIDVILLDIGLPGISGLGAIQMLKEKVPLSEIIMLTIHDDPDKIFRAIKAGALGYLLKNTPLMEIKEAIIEVVNGGAPMSPPIARKIIRFFDASKKIEKKNNLTEKERLIISYMVDGQSFKMIAGNLNNSLETIKYHCKSIYKKLHINSKSEVIAKSIRGEL
jgi:DNA-binding NarL/FixJ family response regulator